MKCDNPECTWQADYEFVEKCGNKVNLCNRCSWAFECGQDRSLSTKGDVKMDVSKLDIDEVVDAMEQSTFGMESIGFCVECGAQTDGVEPDAREYPCDACGECGVYGAEELLMYIVS